MTELSALHDPGNDHTATTCLACGTPGPDPDGHRPTCPAVVADATDLLVEPVGDTTVRTWLVSGAKYNLTPARRARFAAQMPHLTWVRPVDRPNLPLSVGALINAVVPQLGVGRALSEIGYSAAAAVPATDCGCTDVWRCRCDFDSHPFRHAAPDLWPDYALIGLKVRYTNCWSVMWMLDIGVGTVWVAEDATPTPPTANPITRGCYLGWCDRCPGHVPTAEGTATCACPCGHPNTPAEPAETASPSPADVDGERP